MIGEIVGSYEITEQIGVGGMGAVYKAKHTLLGKHSAVKVLLPRMSLDKEIVQRFFNEAKATSLIQHPGIVEVYDYGHLENGNAFIVMELLEGESLGTKLQRLEKLTTSDAIATARHIAGVLIEAHRHGIIHRDLKPDNIYLVADAALPRGERAKVLDFGIAKLSGDAGDKLETRTGQILGTPMYMSPEQCKGTGEIDHRSDIYALGCLLYQMLCGRPPFVGEGSGEILAAQIHVAPSSIREHDSSIPITLANVVMKLIEKNADARYQTMSEVIDALNHARPLTAGETEPSLATSSEFLTPEEAEETQTMATQTMAPLAMAPLADVPTMGADTYELLVLQPRSSLRNVFLATGLVVTVAVGVYVFVSSKGTDSENSSVASKSVAPEADTKVVLTPVIAPIYETLDAGLLEKKPHTKNQVTLIIESDPSGARVYRESDGVRLGETPYNLTLPKGDGFAGFLLKKSGYHRSDVELAIDKSGRSMTQLLRRRSQRPTENNVEEVKPPKKVKPKEKDPVKTPGVDDAIDPFATTKAAQP